MAKTASDCPSMSISVPMCVFVEGSDKESGEPLLGCLKSVGAGVLLIGPLLIRMVLCGVLGSCTL